MRCVFGGDRLGFGRLGGLVAAGALLVSPTTSSLLLMAVALEPRASAAEAAAGEWLTSFDSAMAEAESTGKPVLVVFTGSDWCPHCRTLE